MDKETLKAVLAAVAVIIAALSAAILAFFIVLSRSNSSKSTPKARKTKPIRDYDFISRYCDSPTRLTAELGIF
jgi:Na+-driven multidrug efflux pump